MMEVYVPIPEVATPNMVPVSSNDTSAVGGSTESTRLTSLLPLVSPILSPIMHAPLLSPGLEGLCPGARNCTRVVNARAFQSCGRRRSEMGMHIRGAKL